MKILNRNIAGNCDFCGKKANHAFYGDLEVCNNCRDTIDPIQNIIRNLDKQKYDLLGQLNKVNMCLDAISINKGLASEAVDECKFIGRDLI